MTIDLSKAQKFYGIALRGALETDPWGVPVLADSPEHARDKARAHATPEEARIVPVYLVVEDTPA